MQALAAHEIGHEYVWEEYHRAWKANDDKRRQELELICDAIGVVILRNLGANPSTLIGAVEKISKFNLERFGSAANEGAYPTM